MGKELPVHLLLHGDPYNKENPEVIFWRSRMENVVAEFDGGLKLYDFRLGKNSDNEVEKLSFHLLIPHKYGMSEREICDTLQREMGKYKADIQLSIRFIKSFI